MDDVLRRKKYFLKKHKIKQTHPQSKKKSYKQIRFCNIYRLLQAFFFFFGITFFLLMKDS